MTLVENLVAWINERPSWQRAAIARFCREEDYSDQEIRDLVEQVISGAVPETPPLSVGDISGGSSTGEQVTLAALKGVRGVNALLSSQELSFASTGLTVIFGNNASGKSGYARLLSQAVTARVKGQLLSNVFADVQVAQEASLDYSIDGETYTWTLEEEQHSSLTSVRFYDSDCGTHYISKAAEISYRPYALTLLDRLQSLCRAMQKILDEKIAANELAFPDLPDFAEGTEAASFLTGLNENTTQHDIDEATTLKDDHVEVLEADTKEVARLIASDPSTEKQRLTALEGH